jgi:hypothetical protein
MQRAKEIGIHFAFAESPKKTSHFSTLKTMKEVSEEVTCLLRVRSPALMSLQWMEQILRPYIAEAIEADPELQHDPDQKTILLLDCYPVHTGEEFRKYVQQQFPNVFLVYVPANCSCNLSLLRSS